MTTWNSELWHGSVWNELVFSLTMECINFNFPVFLQSSNMSSCTFFNFFFFFFFLHYSLPCNFETQIQQPFFVYFQFYWWSFYLRSLTQQKHIQLQVLHIPCNTSLLHLMRAIACTHTRKHTQAHAPPVWCVLKIAGTTSVYDTYCLGHWNEENERKNKNIKLKRWSSCFNICSSFISLNVALPCMTSE